MAKSDFQFRIEADVIQLKTELNNVRSQLRQLIRSFDGAGNSARSYANVSRSTAKALSDEIVVQRARIRAMQAGTNADIAANVARLKLIDSSRHLEKAHLANEIAIARLTERRRADIAAAREQARASARVVARVNDSGTGSGAGPSGFGIGSARSIASFAVGFGAFTAVTSAARGLDEVAKSGERVRIALEVATGSAARAEMKFQELGRIAEELALNQGVLSRQYASFAIAAKETSLSAEEVDRAFRGVATAAAGAQLDTFRTEKVFIALQQILSKGTVSAEELRQQMGDSLPGSFSIAAKAMGVTTAELNKMLQKGELAADEFIPKFAAALEEAFGEAAAKNVDSLAGSVNLLHTELFQLADTMAEAGLRDFLTGINRGLADMVRGLSDNIGVLGFAVSGLAAVLTGKLVGAIVTSAARAVAAEQAMRFMGAGMTAAAARAGLLNKALMLLGGPFGAMAAALVGGAMFLRHLKQQQDEMHKAKVMAMQYSSALRDLDAASKQAGTNKTGAGLRDTSEALKLKEQFQKQTALLKEMAEAGAEADKRVRKLAENSITVLEGRIRDLVEKRPELQQLFEGLIHFGDDAAEATDKQADKIEELIEQLEFERSLLKLSAREQFVLRKERTLGADATKDQVTYTRQLAGAIYDETQAIKARKAEEKRDQAAFDAERNLALKVDPEVLAEAEKAIGRLDEMQEEYNRAEEQRKEELAAIYQRTAERIEGIWFDMGNAIVSDFDNAHKEILDSFKKLVVQLALEASRNAILIPLVTQVGQMAGVGGQALGGVVGALGGSADQVAEAIGDETADALVDSAGEIGTSMGLTAGQIIAGAIVGNIAAFQVGRWAGEQLGIDPNVAGTAMVLSPELAFANIVIPGVVDSLVSSIEGSWEVRSQQLGISISDQLFDATLTTFWRKDRPGRSDKFREEVDEATGLDDWLQRTFKTLFANIREAIRVFDYDLSQFDFSTSLELRGLSDDEVKELLSTTVGEAANQLAREILPGIDRFQRAGEELIDTLVRVAGMVGAVDRGMTLLGQTLEAPDLQIDTSNLSGGALVAAQAHNQLIGDFGPSVVDIAQIMSDAAGGLDKLTSGLSDLFEALPEEEQLANLGIHLESVLGPELWAQISNMEGGLTELAQSFGMFTPEQQGLIAGNTAALGEFFDLLLDGLDTQRIAEAAQDVRQAFGLEASDFAQFLETEFGIPLADFQDFIASEQGGNLRAWISSLTDAQQASLLPFINDLRELFPEAVMTAQEALASASEDLRAALEIETSALREAADTFASIVSELTDFQRELRTGEFARLTPQQQYQISRRNFLDTNALAQTGDREALANLDDAAREFLDASRANFATSSRYFQDRDLVDEAISNGIDVAGFEGDLAQQQLDATNAVIAEISGLNSNVTDLNDAVARITEILLEQNASSDNPTVAALERLLMMYSSGTSEQIGLLKELRELAESESEDRRITAQVKAPASSVVPG